MQRNRIVIVAAAAVFFFAEFVAATIQLRNADTPAIRVKFICNLNEVKALLRANENDYLVIYREEGDIFLTKINYNSGPIGRARITMDSKLLGFNSVTLSPDGSGFLLLGVKSVPYIPGEMVAFVMKIDHTMSKQWDHIYPTYSSRVRTCDEIATTSRGTAVIAGFSREEILVTEIDSNGEVVWNSTIAIDPSFVNLVLARTEGEEIMLAATYYNGTSIYRFGNSHEAKPRTELPNFRVKSVVENRGGYLVLGVPNGAPGIATLIKLDREGLRQVWRRELDGFTNYNKYYIGKTLDEGNYLFYGTSGADERIRGFVMNLFGANGTTSWMFNVNTLSSIPYAIEFKPREYVVADSVFIYNYMITPFAERRHCFSLDDCRPCPNSMYWDYNECRPCSEGCIFCIVPELCLQCGSGYSLPPSDPHRCVKRVVTNSTKIQPPRLCNNTAAHNLTIVSCRLNSPKQACGECPTGSVDNSTHCLFVSTTSCPQMCRKCAGPALICVECVRSPGIIQRNLTPPFVSCQCEPGYYSPGWNASCVPQPEFVGSTPNLLLPIVLGVSGAILVSALLAWTLSRRTSEFERVVETSASQRTAATVVPNNTGGGEAEFAAKPEKRARSSSDGGRGSVAKNEIELSEVSPATKAENSKV